MLRSVRGAASPVRIPAHATIRSGPCGIAVQMKNEARRGRHTGLGYGRFVKWLVSGILLIVFASYVALPFGLSWYLPQLAERHGMPLSLTRVRVEPFESRVHLHGVRIGTAQDAATTWSSVEARVDLAALLSGRLVLDDLRMSEAKLLAGGNRTGAGIPELAIAPAALTEELGLGELVIERVELAALSEALGSPVMIDRARIASLAELFGPDGSAIEGGVSVGGGQSRLTGRISADASGWILDVELDASAVSLDGVTALPGPGGSWRGTIDGSGPVRLVYSPVNGAFSATTGGRWAIEGPEVRHADAVISAARAEWDGTAFLVFSESAVELFSIDGELGLRGLDAKDADVLQVDAAAVTLRIGATSSPTGSLSIDASIPVLRFGSRGGAVEVVAAEATHLASRAVVTFADAVAIEIDRLKSSTLTAELPAGRSVYMDRVELERAVVGSETGAATVGAAAAGLVEWRGFTELQRDGTAAGLALQGFERRGDGGIRIALASAETLEAGDGGAALRLHDLVLDGTSLSPAGSAEVGGIRASDARHSSDAGTLVLERLSLAGVERDADGSVSVGSGRALVVDRSLADGQALVGADFELTGATVSSPAWRANALRFGQVDISTGDASYALQALALTDVAGEDGTASAGLARAASIEQGSGGSRITLEDVVAGSPAWNDGQVRADTVEAASLILDIIGQRRWQSSGLRLTGVATESGRTSAASASADNLAMHAADQSTAGARRIELVGLTFEGGPTARASNASVERLQIRGRDGSSAAVEGLRADSLEWSRETLAAERGEALRMTVVGTPVSTSFDTVGFTSVRLGSGGERQLDAMSAATIRGGSEPDRSPRWTAEGLELAGYRASDAGEAALDAVETHAVEVHGDANGARMRAERLSARAVRIHPSGNTMVALAALDGVSVDDPDGRSNASARALQVSRLSFGDSSVGIGSLALTRVDGTIGLTETGSWELPPIPIGAGDGPASFTLRIEEADTADSESVIRFVDRTAAPDFVASIGITRAALHGFDSAAIGVPASFTVEAAGDTFASLRADGALIPTLTGTDLDLNARVGGLSLPDLAPYARLHLGQGIAAGHADLTLDLAVRSSDLEGVASLSSRVIGLGERVSPAPSPTLDSALALMMKRQGGIELQAPLRARVDDPEFDFDGLLARALADRAIETAVELLETE